MNKKRKENKLLNICSSAYLLCFVIWKLNILVLKKLKIFLKNFLFSPQKKNTMKHQILLLSLLLGLTLFGIICWIIFVVCVD